MKKSKKTKKAISLYLNLGIISSAIAGAILLFVEDKTAATISGFILGGVLGYFFKGYFIKHV